VRGLCRVAQLVGHEDAELETDVVGGEDILTRHGERGLAQVVQCDGPAAAPDGVASGVDAADIEAVMVEQSALPFLNHKDVTEMVRDSDGNEDSEGQRDTEQDEVGVHGLLFLPGCGGRSLPPG